MGAPSLPPWIAVRRVDSADHDVGHDEAAQVGQVMANVGHHIATQNPVVQRQFSQPVCGLGRF